MSTETLTTPLDATATGFEFNIVTVFMILGAAILTSSAS